jgi:hypothetical protein
MAADSHHAQEGFRVTAMPAAMWPPPMTQKRINPGIR